METLASHYIAEEVDAVVGFIKSREGTDEVLAMNICGKGVILHPCLYFCSGIYMEIILESIDDGDFPVRPFDRFHITQGAVGSTNNHGSVRAFHSLRFEDTIAVFVMQTYENDDCMIFQALVVIIDIGMGKVQITGRAAADKGNGELARIEHSLRNERFATGHAINVNHGE